jgi:retinol dehydrogenase 12
MAALLSIILESAINKWKTLPDTVVDLSGRTVIVTGSNVGLGLEAAKRFYAMNPARLILAVRTISKGEDAKKVILETGKKEGPYGRVKSETNIEVWTLDLSSFESVRRFAKRCDDELERIDILLENAAVQVGDWSVTNDGWETE